MPINEQTKQLQNGAQKTTKALMALMILQFMLMYFFSFSLNYIWGMMNGLAMIAYLPLINVNFAPNFMMLLEQLIDFITFDVIPDIDGINEYLFTTRYSEGEIG